MTNRGRVVEAVEAALREAFAHSAPVTDEGWREDAEKVTDAALAASARPSSPSSLETVERSRGSEPHEEE